MEQPSVETMQLAYQIFDRYGRLKDELMRHCVRKGSGVWQNELSSGNFLLIESVSVAQKHRGSGIGRNIVLNLIEKAQGLDNDVRFVFAYPSCLHEGEDFQERDGKTKDERIKMADAQTANAIRFFRALGFRRIGLTNWFAFSIKDVNHPSRGLSSQDDPDPPEMEYDENYESDDSQPEVTKYTTVLSSAALKEDGNFDFSEAGFSSARRVAENFIKSKNDRRQARSRFKQKYPIHHYLTNLSDSKALEILKEQCLDKQSQDTLVTMKDGEKNTILHTAACQFKPDCITWILNWLQVNDQLFVETSRNIYGYTPLEALQSKLEEVRLGYYYGPRFILRADQFDGFSDSATFSVLELKRQTRTNLEAMNQARFGCSCGWCLGGFLSRQMVQIITLVAEEVLLKLTETEQVKSHEEWYTLNQDLLKDIPRTARIMFKKSKVLRRGFQEFFKTIIRCVQAGNIPTSENLISLYRSSRLWPQMHAFYFARGGSIDAATGIVLDFAKTRMKMILQGNGSDYLTLSNLPSCRNDYEFELVRRQCTNLKKIEITSPQSSAISLDDILR
ncbi:hypothetical protein VI817_009396 [Penicillium citrinum]|nr:hypothetical protein VI817_009396 [Penicillium citrinum]